MHKLDTTYHVLKLTQHQCNFIHLWNSVLLKHLRLGFSSNCCWFLIMSGCLRILLSPWIRQWIDCLLRLPGIWDARFVYSSVRYCWKIFRMRFLNFFWWPLFYFLLRKQFWPDCVSWVVLVIITIDCVFSHAFCPSVCLWNIYYMSVYVVHVWSYRYARNIPYSYMDEFLYAQPCSLT